MNLRSKSYRIVRRAGQQGARPSGVDQPGVEKLATESISSQTESLDGHQDRRISNSGPLDSIRTQNQKKKRKKWTKEEYKDVMYCFYYTLENPEMNNTDGTFIKWCERNSDSDKRAYLDANTLANVRRYITREKKLTDEELNHIKTQVRHEMRHRLHEETILESNGDHEERELPAAATGENNESPYNPLMDDIVIEKRESEGNEISSMKIDILEEFSKVQQTELRDRQVLLKIRNSRKYRAMFDVANKALQIICNELNPDLTCLNELLYSAGKILQEKCGMKLQKKRRNTRGTNKPKWQLKIEKEIETLRREISLCEELQKDKEIRSSNAKKVVRKYKIVSKSQIPSIKEELKQKLQVKAQRLRRYEKRSKFFRQNKVFETDAKKFYREINKLSISVEKIPSEEEVQEYWSKIWRNEKSYNQTAAWLTDLERRTHNIRKQEWENITVEEISEALKKSHKWKSPGMDQIPNFWLDTLSSTHMQLAINFNNVMKDPTLAPKWFCQGITYLLPKSKDTENPKNYRPITCLSTLYKLLTSILAERTYKHMEQEDIFPIEQKGCRRGSYGTKDQLLINKMILENAHSKHRNLSTAWIDYKKAFDSVPHAWIIRSLELFGISPVLIHFLKSCMSLWETDLHLSHSNGFLTSNCMQIKCGIFQGDSLSPLLFCLALIPLSQLLNDTGYGYRIENRKINHLFYMDDLKIYAKDDTELEKLLHTVQTFSDEIGMEFGLDKCAKATFKHGKMVKSTNIVLNDNTVIKELDQENTYKYLGVNESNGIQHSTMKENIRKECIRRVRSIMKTELNSKNRITAINALAIPVVTYSFNVVNWNLQELKKLDTKIRKQLTCNRMHHPKSDVDRLYIPRSKGGRGMI